jgi:hypothetical protein
LYSLVRLHGLIARVPKSHRYRLMDEGGARSCFPRDVTLACCPGFAQVLPNEAVPDTMLRRRFDQLDAAIDLWHVANSNRSCGGAPAENSQQCRF